ncbi:MAG: sigma-70 family RNA polymerase sigma factor [Calditrichaeota bacterium]|nr:MAG: sigma-70 family RNA polymerase sigma factor [Calditrichota bacterium]
MDTPEHDIIREILAGNRERFSEIVQRYQNLVAMIISQLTSSREEINELSQQVFVKAYLNLKNFRGEAKFSTWISRIAYNTTVNHLKKKKALSFVDFFGDNNDNRSPAGEEKLITRLASPDEILNQKEMAEIIQKGIQQIPEQYRVVLTLYHQQHFSYEEIAKITGIPMGTVKNYLHRARKYLKDLLVKELTLEELQL